MRNHTKEMNIEKTLEIRFRDMVYSPEKGWTYIKSNMRLM